MSHRMKGRYNNYGNWLRERFGGRVYKVSVDGGFSCPNRDGTVAFGGCSYCNNDSFRTGGAIGTEAVENQLRRGMDFLSRRFQADRFIAYWQHYSNTYAPVERLRELFTRSLDFDDRVVGLAIGTRPDCVEDEKLDLLSELALRAHVTLEYGLESIYDATLARLNRGHDLACCFDAIQRTRSRRLPVCLHVILGFPWETREQMLGTAEVLNRLDVDFVKIHHLHVVRRTALAKSYAKEPFLTFSCPEWTTLVCDFLERLSPKIVVQRLFGWAPAGDLVAPRWDLSKAEVLQGIRQELEMRDSWQGKKVRNIS
jgi:uncharacterized protein